MFKEYAKYYDMIYMKKKPYKKEIKFVDKWAEHPRTILDIGCGTASYWNYFRTNHILGIEKSQKMIDESGENDMWIVEADITTKEFHVIKNYDCVTALFDVMNYLPRHDWWKRLPLKKGGFFIFDMWDLEKVRKDGFHTTITKTGGIERRIEPVPHANDDKRVSLNILIKDGNRLISEKHKMYLYSEKDIDKFCGKEFRIVDTKETKTWQKWYKLKRL